MLAFTETALKGIRNYPATPGILTLSETVNKTLFDTKYFVICTTIII